MQLVRFTPLQSFVLYLEQAQTRLWKQKRNFAHAYACVHGAIYIRDWQAGVFALACFIRERERILGQEVRPGVFVYAFEFPVSQSVNRGGDATGRTQA